MIKLIKHELKDTSRIVLPVVGSLVALALLAIGVGVLRGLESRSDVFVNLALMLIALSVFIGMVVFLIIYVVFVFSNRVFSKEGYLTLSLPVSGYAIIFSKLFVTIFWAIISLIVAGSLTFLILTRFIDIQELKLLLDQFIRLFVVEEIAIGRGLFDIFINALITVLLIWFALLLAQTGRFNQRVVWSIILVIVLSGFKSLLQEAVFGAPLSSVAFFNYNSDPLTYFNIGLAVVLFLLDGYFLENKVSLA